MSDVQITLKDGRQKKFPKNTTYKEMSETFADVDKIIGVMVNNRVVSLADKCDQDEYVDFIKMDDSNGNRIYCAGLKMVFEYALKRSFPSFGVSFAYSLPSGIVATIESDRDIIEDDVKAIKKAMLQVVEEDRKIEKLIIRSCDGITYYKKLGNKVKQENIQNIMDGTVMLYRLDSIVNYYYSEMPYSTGILNEYEIRYLGNNKVLISYPKELDKGIIPKYTDYSGVMEAYEKGKAWLNTMHVPYINDVNREIYKGRAYNFVKSSELNFNLGINETAKMISENNKIKYVLIAGPSSSGKTTVTKRLASYFEIYGKKTIVVSLDDYFLERERTPKDEYGEYDFESAEALDVAYLNTDVTRLLKGEKVTLPKFNFITGHKELSEKSVQADENTIILFEGLHALTDSLMPMLKKEEKYKIYVSPYIPLCLDEHSYISLNDLRLLRRMVRDFRTRGTSVDRTLEYWRKVRNGEEKYIVPHIHEADKIINTSLPYEVGVLKVMVEPLLYSITSESKYYNEARRLLNFLKQFFTINTEYVPKDSIIREFIGGNNND